MAFWRKNAGERRSPKQTRTAKPGRSVIPRSGRRPAVRKYNAAGSSLLFSDWPAVSVSVDADIRRALLPLRARSRDLAQNSDYAKQFARLVRVNVVGPEGVRLQVRLSDAEGRRDRPRNEAIEAAFKDWGKRHCEVTGKSWLQVQLMLATIVPRDGEGLVRLVRNARNPYRFALQVIPIELLPVQYEGQLENGNRVFMGIEFDAARRVVAYHLATGAETRASYMTSVAGRAARLERVPAADILHIFLAEDPVQSRGVPWVHTAAIRAKMLDGYEEAEVVAARTAAGKVGVWTQTDPEAGPPLGVPPDDGLGRDDDDDEGGYYDAGETGSGEFVEQAEAGTYVVAPAGHELKTFDPQHPNANYGNFVRGMVQGIASGLGVSYAALSGDLTSVNYSSIRAGYLSEQDVWRLVQAAFIEALHERVFETWLEFAILGGQLNERAVAVDEIVRATRWAPRGWQWVDPQREAKAASDSIDKGLTSRTRTLARQGVDFYDVVDELADELEYAADRGVNVSGQAPAPPAPAPAAAPEADDQADDQAGAGEDTQDDRADRRGLVSLAKG